MSVETGKLSAGLVSPEEKLKNLREELSALGVLVSSGLFEGINEENFPNLAKNFEPFLATQRLVSLGNRVQALSNLYPILSNLLGNPQEAEEKISNEIMRLRQVCEEMVIPRTAEGVESAPLKLPFTVSADNRELLKFWVEWGAYEMVREETLPGLPEEWVSIIQALAILRRIEILRGVLTSFKSGKIGFREEEGIPEVKFLEDKIESLKNLLRETILPDSSS